VIFLLILGAGASRSLGDTEDSMPLMSDWSTALSAALDSSEQGLAGACHLEPDMRGPEFERNLGLLLRWEQVRELEERFERLGGQTPEHQPPGALEARKNQTRRLATIKRIINQTLYEQFGHKRVNDDRATAAYRLLLKELDDPELIVATTNYDRAVETALENANRSVDTGFRYSPNRAPVLDVKGLIDDRGSKTPVIHLHGAVGWYENDGAVNDFYADLGFNSTLGTPVVLYPDPAKDPTNDAVVSDLWNEFHTAIAIADRILVIGHSLHDPALVEALREASSKVPTVITYCTSEGKEAIGDQLPDAVAVEMVFGPKIKTKWPLRQLTHEDYQVRK
jgi:hypothetical protein